MWLTLVGAWLCLPLMKWAARKWFAVHVTLFMAWLRSVVWTTFVSMHFHTSISFKFVLWHFHPFRSMCMQSVIFPASRIIRVPLVGLLVGDCPSQRSSNVGDLLSSPYIVEDLPLPETPGPRKLSILGGLHKAFEICLCLLVGWSFSLTAGVRFCVGIVYLYVV